MEELPPSVRGRLAPNGGAPLALTAVGRVGGGGWSVPLTMAAQSAIIVQVTRFHPSCMKAVSIMEKTIGAFEVRRQFGKMLTGILSGGDRYIIERHGEPVAVLVPLELYEQWQRGRDRFFDHIEAVAKSANMAPEEADELVGKAIREERAKRTA